MIAIRKTLLLTITLFYITIINTNAFADQFKCYMEKTTKYTVEECEKESKEEKSQIDEFTISFFTYSVFSNIAIDYFNKQKKNSFKLSIIPYRPPITS